MLIGNAFSGQTEALFRSIEELLAYAFTFETDLSRLWALGDPADPGEDPAATVTEEFLPYLAWALGVELWPRNELVSFDEKRALVQTYGKIRRLRGTKEALRLAYQAIGVEGDITERPGDKPYTVRISFSSEKKNITTELRNAILRLTDNLKPVRVKYDVEVTLEFAGNMQALGAASLRPVLKGYGGRAWPF